MKLDVVEQLGETAVILPEPIDPFSTRLTPP
jgi:hypothetical protein